MKNLLLFSVLIACSAPLYASDAHNGNPFSGKDDYPVAATLATSINASAVTPAVIALYAPDSGCVYTGSLSGTDGDDNSIRVINVNRKRCGHKVDHVDLIVPEIVASKDYDEGTAVKLYRSSILTPAGPLLSPELARYILEQAKESALQATQQTMPEKDH